MDLKKVRDAMRQPVFIDGRNLFDPQQMQELGFIYKGIGR
jgi:UDPglucose 6-dehydrogenase